MMASVSAFASLLLLSAWRAFFVLSARLWLTTSPRPMSPATRTRAAPVVPRLPPGARRLAAAVGAADERLTLGGGGVQPAGAGGISSPGCWRWLGMVCAGFLAFILFTSGPFARTLPAFPVEGRDPEPAAAGPGAGFSTRRCCTWAMSASVAFAIAALSGRLTAR